MAKFKEGESAVCINDDFTYATRKYSGTPLTFPKRGKCYVVRGYAVRGKFPAVLLIGIKNPRVRYMDGVTREAGFWEERFERAPGIEDLTKIATEVTRWCSAPVREDEDALERV
jgi:hypothetical protein